MVSGSPRGINNLKREHIYQALVDWCQTHGGNSPSYRQLLFAIRQPPYQMRIELAQLRRYVDQLIEQGRIKRHRDGQLLIVGAVWLPPMDQL